MSDIYSRSENCITSYKIGLEILKMWIDDISSIDDPVIRSVLLVEKLMLLSSTAKVAFKALLQDLESGLKHYKGDKDKEEDRDTNREKEILRDISETRKIADSVTEELRSLVKDHCQWVRNPTYGPDHAMGRNIMKESRKDFEKKQ